MHAVAMREAQHTTASLARLVAEQSTRSLQTVEQALLLSRSRLDVLDAGQRLDEATAREALRERLRDLPYVRAIWVLDAKGIIRHDSDVGNLGVSLADRDYFRVHVERPDSDFYLGRPVRSRSLGTWLVSASLPIRGRDGALVGVIAAAIEPPYFDRLWSELGLGRDGSITLFRRDGVLMMRSPFADEAIGRSFAGRGRFASISSAPAGTLQVTSSVDGVRRVVSFRRLAQYPEIVAVVGESRQALLAPWRRAVTLGVAAWLLAALTVGVLCGLLIRELDRRRRSEARTMQSQKIEAIGTLAGGVAHDFNNLLGAILGNASLARSALPPDHPVQAYLGEMDKAGLRGRALVQQILSFSRDRPLEHADVALQPLVEETLSLLRATLPASVELVPRLPAGTLYVRGDATRIQQVVVNLCTNAWRALVDGRGRVEIGFEAVTIDAARAPSLGLRAGEHVHLWVADNGRGMDDEVRRRLFEPFFTTRPREGGTGLGLWMVQHIVQLHGGGVAVDSRPGAGSTFHVYLPGAAAPVEAEAPAAAPAAPADGRGRHVLLVDDDDVIRLMAERLLRREGFEVTACERPHDALTVLQRGGHDAVVSDQDMPGLSGVQLAAEVARLRPGLPVLLTSGSVTEELLAQARAAGVQQVLHKQTLHEELGPALARALAGASSTTAADAAA